RGDEQGRIAVVEVVLALGGIPLGRRLEGPLDENAGVAQLQLLGVRVVLVRAVDGAVQRIDVVFQAHGCLPSSRELEKRRGLNGLGGGESTTDGCAFRPAMRLSFVARPSGAAGGKECPGTSQRRAIAARYPQPGATGRRAASVRAPMRRPPCCGCRCAPPRGG